ncbi:MAG: C25 family cysteine peptidase, partial [Planctomycetota bacterium]
MFRQSMRLSAMLLVGWMMPTDDRCRCQAVDAVVVCDDSLLASIQPWLEHRRLEGLSLLVCQPSSDPDTMRDVIRAASDDQTRYLVLIGDVPTIGKRIHVGAIPAFHEVSQVGSQFGSTPTYPSDRPYGSPSVAVGRWPVRTPTDCRQLVNRILAYEKSNDFGRWRRQFQFTAGIGGFGPIVDSAIESITRTVLTDVLPPEVMPQIAYASPGHPFCPVGDDFAVAVQSRLKRGSRFWVYAGHGSVDCLNLLGRSDDEAKGVRKPL